MDDKMLLAMMMPALLVVLLVVVECPLPAEVFLLNFVPFHFSFSFPRFLRFLFCLWPSTSRQFTHYISGGSYPPPHGFSADISFPQVGFLMLS